MGSHGPPPWKRVPKTPPAEVATSALRMLGLTQDPYAEDWALQRMEDTEKADSVYYDLQRRETWSTRVRQ